MTDLGFLTEFMVPVIVGICLCVGYVVFQSTLLQEERRQKCTIILILICNNYCIVSIKSHQHYNNYFM